MDTRQREEHRNVLIVDDDSSIRRIFGVLLSRFYTVREAASGDQALEIASHWTPDLVLLDIMMPGIDGYETCRRFKAASMAEPPQIIMVSGKSAVTEQVHAFEVGADDYLIKPVDPADLRARVELHFRLRDNQRIASALQGQIDLHHGELQRIATVQSERLLATQDVAVFMLAKVAESRDNDTGDHLFRLRAYAQVLAKELAHRGPYADKISEAFLVDLYRSSPLHDIGKVGIPDSILLKPGSLTPEEFDVMKRHVMIGGNILHEAVMQLDGGGFLTMASLIARFHHERWDGEGYLAGLVGDEIPLAARIVSVADVFDALTSRRTYKEAWTPHLAKETIDEGAGTQFDPSIVTAFDACFDDFLRIHSENADKNQTVVGAVSFQEHDLLQTV